MMKKTIWILVFATVLAVPAAFAFTQQRSLDPQWQFMGNTGEELDASKYVEVTTSPGCSGYQ